MGFVFRRGSSLWIGFADEQGNRKRKPSGYAVGDERLAEEALRIVERRIAARQKIAPDGPVTLSSYAERWLADWLPPQTQGRFLEVGGGLCYVSALVKRLRPGWHVTATDVSIRYLQHHAVGVGAFMEGSADWYAAADAAHLPFEDQQFDRVFSQIVLYRVPKLDQALAEIRRVLRPGGRWLGIERASPWALPWWEAERRWMAERTQIHGWMERPVTLRDWQDRLRGLGGTAEYLRPHRRRGWLNAIRAEHVRLEFVR